MVSHVMKRKFFSVVAVLLFGILISGIFFLLFRKEFKSLAQELARKESHVVDIERLVLQKERIQEEWNEKKEIFEKGASDDELNRWVKDLITRAQAEGIIFEKIEPREGRQTEEGLRIGVTLSYEGDIRTFVRFLHGLYQTDSLAKLDSFLVEQNEEVGKLSYELTLIKLL